MRVTFGVVINRHVPGSNLLEDYCKKEGLDVIGIIPESREIAAAYSEGDCASLIRDRHSDQLQKVADHIRKKSRGD